MGKVLGIIRLPLIFSWIILCIPIQIIARFFDLGLRQRFPVFFHWVLTRLLLGLHVKVNGVIHRTPPTFFISNHISYLDILAMSSVMPCSFVAKADVADWPLFGLLAKLQDTVFVQRRRHAAKSQNEIVAQALSGKRQLVIFPEGTSTEGLTVLPFKSTLLQSVYDGDPARITIQPVAIAFSHPHGLAHLYPWHGDMTLVDHLWKLVQVNGLTVEISFLPPVSASQFTDRKALATYAHAQVSAAPHGIQPTPALTP